jgi:hypothetical protein
MKLCPLRLILLAAFLSACVVGAAPTPAEGGITGQALVGPMCPVLIEGQDCPDQPYQATLTVPDRGGRKMIIQFQTDEEGKFRVPLAPGEYLLRPETPEGVPYPIAGEQTFRVNAGEFTRLIVSYDSGIR